MNFEEHGNNDIVDFGTDDTDFGGSGDDFFGSDDDFGGDDDDFANENDGFDDDSSGAMDDILSGEADTSGDVENSSSNKKAAIIVVIIGIVVVLAVFFVAMKLRSGKDTDTEAPVETSTTSSVKSEKSEEKPKVTEDANKVMSGGRGDKVTEPEKDPSAIGGYNKSDNWIETEMLDDVTFQSEYIDIQFYVTGINHYVKEVEGSNNIVLKSTLTGSLSGYPGTYTLDIPYDKGIRLSVGTSFDVQVQVGECQGRAVVGEIIY